MTVSKELLQDLKIVSTNVAYFNAEENSIANECSSDFIPCVLTKFDNGKLFFNLLENKTISQIDKKDVFLRIVIQEDETWFIKEEQKLNIIESGFDYVIATVNAEYLNIKRLIERLYDLDLREKKYGRRKEMRIKIGKERSSAFGLSCAEQKIFLKSAKIVQPCAVLDASLHGICVITPFENASFKNAENFTVCLSFVNPEQTALLHVHKVHLKLTKTNDKVFSTISCQLLEPVCYVWKERVVKMIEDEYKSREKA